MTGATGFLGTYLLRDLLREGRRVLALVREPVEESRRRLLEGLAALDVRLAPFVAEASRVWLGWSGSYAVGTGWSGTDRRRLASRAASGGWSASWAAKCSRTSG